MSIRCCAPSSPPPPVSETGYQTTLEVIWRKLRPHLEWTQGFTLAVLFTRHPAPVAMLRNRLQEVLSLNTIPLRLFELEGPGQTGDLLQAVLSSRPLNGKHPPLWLEMWRETGNTEERQAQRRAVWEVLSRLNERRFFLERDVASPLVLVLPAELRQDIPAMAPDLWSVRAVTADLPAPEMITSDGRMESPKAKIQGIVNHEPSAAEQEWQRLWATTPDRQRLTPEAAFPAITQALKREDHSTAQEIIQQVMQVIDQQGNDPAALRQRAITFSFLGDLELRSGHPEKACAAYAESLELSRRLREATGDTLQALRDLSVSLDNIGDVEQALNRFEEARVAYAESLEIRRRLREATGDTPQALHDLSVSLDNIGNVEQALNRFEEARAAYAESLELCRRLQEATGDTPQALRDLSVSLDNIGNVEQALNRFEEARAAYAESLELRRRLREATGDTPQVPRDLSVALDNIGNVEQALNRFEEARTAYAESLELCRQLREATGDTPQALRDLSVSLDNIGDVEQALNRFEEARTAYAESLELRRRLREATESNKSSF